MSDDVAARMRRYLDAYPDADVAEILEQLDLEAHPERSEGVCERCDGDGCRECLGTGRRRAHGRGFSGADAETARAILASVRENHTAQAAGRYARNPDDPTSTATVYVRTDGMPPGFADVQVPGVAWTYSDQQDRIVEALRTAEEPLSAREISNRAGCTKQHVRETLQRLEREAGGDRIHAFDHAGRHGATLYAAAGVPNAGVVDIDGIANDPVWDSCTWALAIRAPAGDDEPRSVTEPVASDTSTVFWPPSDRTDPGDSEI